MKQHFLIAKMQNKLNVLGCILVSQALRENTYPFLAMIMLKDRKMTVVGRLEGVIQPEDLINQLTFVMDANQTYLMSERLERYSESMCFSLVV